MNTKPSKHGGGAVDLARATLCRNFTRLLDAGASAVRTRIVRSPGKAAEAWFYGRLAGGWRKEPEAVSDPALVEALEETLAMLASRTHGDEWSARQRARADYRDTDIRFHRDKLSDRTGKALESAVDGLLFRDRHDSKQDCRRTIRTPRPKAAGK